MDKNLIGERSLHFLQEEMSCLKEEVKSLREEVSTNRLAQSDCSLFELRLELKDLYIAHLLDRLKEKSAKSESCDLVV